MWTSNNLPITFYFKGDSSPDNQGNNGGTAAGGPVAEEQLPPLPDGWERRIRPDGANYWVNHLNKTTQW